MRSITWIGALLCSALAASAQDKATAPKPQKEHEALKAFEGRWDVKCKWMFPGRTPEENTATQASRLAYGGFWLQCDFRGEFDKKSFHWMWMTGFDPSTKKYVAVGFGSDSPNPFKVEGEADSSFKKWTLKGECMDPSTGKMAPHKVVWEFSDKDHYTERVFMTGDDGKETLVGEFTYSRRGAKAESK